MSATFRRSLFTAGAYFGVASVYILVSSHMARSGVTDIDALHLIEEIKGLMFVSITAAVVFTATYAALKRADRVAKEVARQREALVSRERQALAGMMAAAIAHDANNVLTALMFDLKRMDRGAIDKESIAGALVGLSRLNELNRRLLNAARQSTENDVCVVDVGVAVKETLDVLRFHHALSQCRIDVQATEDAVVRANPVLIHQMVSNLVINAGEATNGKGHVALEVSHDATNGTVSIHVDDEGAGIPSEQRSELFSALKTTKRDGTGLGLYSARACATAVGGQIEIGDSPLGGARFTVVIPAAARSARSERAQPAGATAPT